ncbi:Apoptosis-inducing factor 1, mitochondrial [Hypsibius exemplaris]|uniref:Apoptosis-inducing factor 1, mitochondrial n=1 Tax=Hypsibius exemplaris TaxID=2072580 RepID=A0A1W0WCS6_HYPEX|nr:Apoptosis-inducing factor 1, mitochondrial [Hypsibius exemplaris]
MRLLSLFPTRSALQSVALKNPLRSVQVVRLASGHHHNEKEQEPEDPWADNKPYVPPTLKRRTFDEFPVPEGSWQEAYDKQQKSHGLQFAVGLSFLGATIFYMWYKDPLDIEKVFGPRKYMKNPPAFFSPTLEPRFDAEFRQQTVSASPEVVRLEGASLPKDSVAVPVRNATATSDTSVTDKPVPAKSVPEAPPRKSASVPPVGALNIPAVPTHVPYLIIGGGTAAFSAFRAIRANDPTATVLVVSEDSYNPYMRPPLTKELWFSDEPQKQGLRFKQLNGKERSIFFEHEEFYVDPKLLSSSENGGVAVLKNTRVTRLDPKEQRVTLQDGREIHYDRCLLATGASPRPLPVLESGGPELMKHVTLFRGVDSFKELDVALKTAKKVLVIGGGFLGSELACSLARQGLDSGLQVLQVYPEKGNLGRILPEYLSDWLTRKLRIVDGVRVYPERFVKGAKLVNGGITVQLNDDEEITADHIVVAVGVTPNTDLAAGAELEVDDILGGYRVNAELEARSNLWAAGDAASYFDVTLGRRRLEHHDHAVATGRTAGDNMAGKGKPFWHQSMFWSDIGPEVGFEGVGLIDSSLETVAVFARPDPAQAPNSAQVAADLKQLESLQKDNAGYSALSSPNPKDDYRRGVIFYLKDKIIVGVLLWNIFSHISLARKVIKDQKTFGDLGELAKLFALHDDDDAAPEKSSVKPPTSAPLQK